MHSVAVQLQLSLVAKCSLARGTGKCKLPYLRLHVSFQVTGDESYATHTAVVGLLSSVNSYVHGKVGRVRETLATLNTIIQTVLCCQCGWENTPPISFIC